MSTPQKVRAIPYRPTSKSFLISKLLIAGKNANEIEKTLNVAKSTISGVKGKLWRKGILKHPTFPETSSTPVEKSFEETSKQTQTRTGEDGIIPQSSDIIKSRTSSVDEDDEDSLAQKFSTFKDEIIKSVADIIKQNQSSFVGIEKPEDFTTIDTDSVIPKKVFLTPKTLMFYDLARTNGYLGELSSFINECVDEYHSQKKVGIGMTRIM